MADIIRQLPDSVANQIAAGEVIQRPSSVIKELVENAVDAGATEVRIQIVDAGRTLIKVTDNGRGMSPTDARMAFERHATSKIRQADDLFRLHTMGFRGEALPSICAISQVELRSAMKDEPMGTKLQIDGSEIMGQEPCVCPVGTTIMVKNIFFNVPARRRFLKSDAVEMANIIREFERMALVNHNVRFVLDTGTRKRDLMAAGFKQRITDLWKGSLNPELLPVNVDTDLVRISGFISRPEHARRRNALQYLIANGRCMQHPYFHRGVVSCYDRLIAPDTKPCYFLRFEVNPADIDVNIHPTKSEIKFEHEQEIYKLLVPAIHATLGKYGVVPSIDFSSDALEVQPLREGETVEAPAPAVDMNYNPFSQARRTSSWRTPPPSDWQSLYDGFNKARPATEGEPQLPLDFNAHDIGQPAIPHNFGDAIPDPPAGMIRSITPDSPAPATSTSAEDIEPLCLQLHESYIVAPANNGLMVIDQYRAHVAILYHQILHASSAPMARQGVLFSEEIHLDTRQNAVLEDAIPRLEELGISLHRQGDAWVIETLPATISARQGRDIILQTIDALQTDSDQYGKPQTTSHNLRASLALTMARAGAVKKGQSLSQSEMEQLLSSLLRLPDPATGPDGKRIIYLIETQKINSLFS